MDSADNTKTYKWLIFIFIHEIMEYKSESQKLLKEISKYIDDNSDNVKIIVLLDSIQFRAPNNEYCYHYSLREYYRKEGKTKFTYRKLTYRHHGIDLYESEAWKPIFSYVFKTFPSEKKILVTWTHGKGFGLDLRRADELEINSLNVQSSGTVVEIKNTIQFVNKNLLDKKKLYSGEFKCGKEQKNEMLPIESDVVSPCRKANVVWMQEIHDVLTQALPGDLMIDILLMVNCNMQMADNGFILKNKVKYLVAPQSVFPYYGYNYLRLFNLLRRHPNIPNKLLVRKITEDYILKYSTELAEGIDIVSESTVFCNKLKYYDELSTLINNLSDYLKLRIEEPEFLSMFIKIRKERINDVSKLGLGLVDLGLLIECLADTPSPFQYQFKVFLDRYKSIRKRIVKSSFVGEFFTLSDKFDTSRYSQRGISIYFPADTDITMETTKSLCAYYDPEVVNKFAQNSTWDDFLQHYLEKAKALTV